MCTILQPRLEKGSHIGTDPPSSGSAEALVGVTRMSVQSLQVAVFLDLLDVLVVVDVVVRVTFLIPLHSLFIVLLH